MYHYPLTTTDSYIFNTIQVAAKKQEPTKKKPTLALVPDPALALVPEAEGLAKGLGQGYADPSVQSWHLSASLSVTGGEEG